MFWGCRRQRGRFVSQPAASPCGTLSKRNLACHPCAGRTCSRVTTAFFQGVSPPLSPPGPSTGSKLDMQCPHSNPQAPAKKDKMQQNSKTRMAGKLLLPARPDGLQCSNLSDLLLAQLPIEKLQCVPEDGKPWGGPLLKTEPPHHSSFSAIGRTLAEYGSGKQMLPPLLLNTNTTTATATALLLLCCCHSTAPATTATTTAKATTTTTKTTTTTTTINGTTTPTIASYTSYRPILAASC